ncbi:hypothetical protein GVAV_002687 [Gurleya vavrai]
MFGLFIVQAFLQISEYCEIPKELSLTLYTEQECEDCEEQIKIFNELILPQKIIKRQVDCNSCECDDVSQFPTMKISEDGKNTAQISGLHTINEIYSFLKMNGFEEVENLINIRKWKAKRLKLSDISQNIVRPWLILFYKNESDPMIDIFDDLAGFYKEKCSFGIIHKTEFSEYEEKLNIRNYPSIFAYYNGLSEKFNQANTVENLKIFVENLIKPVLKEINYQEFSNLKNKDETVFIVFYKNKEIAYSNFKKLADIYRFICPFYISNDQNLIDLANVSFQTKNKQIDPKNVLVLVAFKHNKFHQLKISSFNFENINEWIFHSHYPHLTKVNHDNFYRIFNGMKPVVLLLTENEKFDSEFEKIAEEMHGGRASLDYVFATLDVNNINGFVDTLLPKFKVPGVLVYQPKGMFYYASKDILSDEKFEEYVRKLIKDYENEKLETYPFKKRKSIRNQIFGLLFILLCVVFLVYPRRNKQKDE